MSSFTPLWYFDEALEDAYDNPDWLAEAMASDPIADSDLFAGVHTMHLQDGVIENDVNVFCKATDIDGEYTEGVIKSWHVNPYDLYGLETSKDYAYILTSEGATYSHISNILPIHETYEVNHELTSNALPEVFNTASGIGYTEGELAYQNLYALPSAARFFGLAV